MCACSTAELTNQLSSAQRSALYTLVASVTHCIKPLRLIRVSCLLLTSAPSHFASCFVLRASQNRCQLSLDNTC